MSSTSSSTSAIAFFQEVVCSFISKKLWKTFLDYYLLVDQEEIVKSSRTNTQLLRATLLVKKLKAYGKENDGEFDKFFEASAQGNQKIQ